MAVETFWTLASNAWLQYKSNKVSFLIAICLTLLAFICLIMIFVVGSLPTRANYQTTTELTITQTTTTTPETTLPPTKIMFNVSQTQTNAKFTVSCGSNSYLSYCGNQKPNIAAWDHTRYSIPMDANTCACKDTDRMTCDAWCSKSVIQDFEIVSQHIIRDGTANCSAGKQVLGCQFQPDQPYLERTPHYYPSNDGLKCTCYHNYGGTCIATCGSNLQEYEIVAKVGSGMTRAVCPRGKTVQGCGLYSAPGDKDYHYTFVKDNVTCSCLAGRCYAVCAL